MWFVGFCELILLRETGARELDDNFAWGYDFCVFILFVVSVLYFVKNVSLLSKKIVLCDMSDNTDIQEKEKRPAKGFGIAYQIAAFAALLYQVYCGVYFFVRLSQGLTFFMQ